MSTLASTLTLPAPFTLEAAGASVGPTGARSVSWTLYEPGKIHGNGYAWGHVSLKEREPWSGECFLTGQRRLTSDGQRLPWTERCLAELGATLVAQVHAYGFSRLWQQLHWRGTQTAEAGSERQAELAAELVRWWSEKAILDGLYAAGMLDARDLPKEWEDRYGERVKSRTNVVLTIPATHRRTERIGAVAELRFHTGELVGYLTSRGETCPLTPELTT